MIAVSIPKLKTLFCIFLMKEAVLWNVNRYSVGKHDQEATFGCFSEVPPLTLSFFWLFYTRIYKTALKLIKKMHGGLAYLQVAPNL